ncbi:Enoyl-CoA delta isomerase 2, mitochondrial [Orchesella cincta]|uniref:Enoyl-CoA delta isomerase 2, mitochondrial n=1 Tax=Orchesella cincta TaxID=48709 RepID=A0A1D2MUQ3_ORCCI|nr:Enoyl-CoA delta isomerase 2, mitochondrial [Orchesella cincta]
MSSSMPAINLLRFSKLTISCKNFRHLPSVALIGGFSKRQFSVSPKTQTDKVLVSVENGVRKIVFNRPEARNALQYEMMDKIGNALFEANSDSATKLVTVTGTGEFFSSGNDLGNWHTANQTIPEIKEKTRRYVMQQLMFGFIDCRKPIIALVNGPAIGAGATMLPFCDQVLASDKAFFSTPFPAIGIVPEFCPSYLFPKIMGYSKANNMLLFCHKLTAKEAQECGFVTRVFPSESFAESCKKLIDAYVQLPTEPMLQAKELIRAPEREKLKQICAYEMDLVIDSIDSPHVRSNIDNFFARKKK